MDDALECGLRRPRAPHVSVSGRVLSTKRMLRAKTTKAPAQIQKTSLQSARCRELARKRGTHLATVEAPKLPHILLQASVAATWLRPRSWASDQIAGLALSVAKATNPQAITPPVTPPSFGHTRSAMAATSPPMRIGRRRPQRGPNQRVNASHHQPPNST